MPLGILFGTDGRADNSQRECVRDRVLSPHLVVVYTNPNRANGDRKSPSDTSSTEGKGKEEGKEPRSSLVVTDKPPREATVSVTPSLTPSDPSGSSAPDKSEFDGSGSDNQEPGEALVGENSGTRQNYLLWAVERVPDTSESQAGEPLRRCSHCPPVHILSFKNGVAGITRCTNVLQYGLPVPGLLPDSGNVSSDSGDERIKEEVNPTVLVLRERGHLVADGNDTSNHADLFRDHLQEPLFPAVAYGSLDSAGRRAFQIVFGCSTYHHGACRFRLRIQLVGLNPKGRPVLVESAVTPLIRVMSRQREFRLKESEAAAAPPLDLQPPKHTTMYRNMHEYTGAPRARPTHDGQSSASNPRQTGYRQQGTKRRHPENEFGGEPLVFSSPTQGFRPAPASLNTNGNTNNGNGVHDSAPGFPRPGSSSGSHGSSASPRIAPLRPSPPTATAPSPPTATISAAAASNTPASSDASGASSSAPSHGDDSPGQGSPKRPRLRGIDDLLRDNDEPAAGNGRGGVRGFSIPANYQQWMQHQRGPGAMQH